MLNTGIAFAGGQLNVGNLNIILKIKPHFSTQIRRGGGWHNPDRGHLRLISPARLWWPGPLWREPCGLGSILACLGGICQHIWRIHRAAGNASCGNETLTIIAGWRAFWVGGKMGLLLNPVQLATAMGPQMHHGGKAARHGHAIAFNFLARTAVAILQTDGNPRHAAATFDLGNGATLQNFDTQSTGLPRQITIGLRARINNCRDFQPRIMQRNCSAIRVIIIGDNHGFLPHSHAPIHQIITHSRGQHHARNIVASKRQAALNRARGGDDLFGPDAPQTMTRRVGAWRVIGDLLIAQRIAVIINPCPRHAVSDGDVLHALKGLQRVVHPIIRRLASNFSPVHRRAATPVGGLLDQQHLGTRLTCRQCGLQPSNTAADNQDIGEVIKMLVAIRIAFFSGFAKASRVAHDWLKNMFPRGTGEHEGFVVKPCRQETADVVVNHAHIIFQAGPVVLGFGL